MSLPKDYVESSILKCVDSGDDTIVGVGTMKELVALIPSYCKESGAMPDDLIFTMATVQEINTEKHNSGKSDKN